jgi:hypothetical protein
MRNTLLNPTDLAFNIIPNEGLILFRSRAREDYDNPRNDSLHIYQP